MRIRQMDAGDIDSVAAIEANCSSPWTMRQVGAECQRKNGLALVASSSSSEVMGWCCGLQVGSEVELLKLAVSPAWRRQGVAQALLLELCHQFAARGGEQVFLEVRSQNIPALQLYTKLGWQETGRRKKYYSGPVDDALIFVGKLD